jgi:diguanylate cyclase (GGDEF)-like protein
MGMEAGADDYVTKPFKPQELRLRLRAGHRIIELQNELIEAREALHEKATHDSLTGLWNHEEILRILDRQLSMAERERGCVSVLMADLDHFKQINDTFGHQAGDTVLRETAEKMAAHIRPYDAVGRYGGEEFLLVLPNCDEKCALDLSERLRSSIYRKKKDSPDSPIPVSISIGVASSGIGEKHHAEVLLSAADTALYQAKKKGRNRVETAMLGLKNTE